MWHFAWIQKSNMKQSNVNLNNVLVNNVTPAPTHEVTVKEEIPVNVQQQKDVKGEGKEKPEISELPLDDT
ncbi:hypothetical protein QVD17_01085 [Tagetes erecta]|uniref:Uncharacterized protein n=1 Tax=Tagetes erecta TaxID=13708 RepID=A0AAD8L6Z3_TARER|nr:hypothetical protein QVD17_01085 [Tagetes erecta]